MAKAARLPVLYDQDCGLCQATARFLRVMDRRRQLELVPFVEARERGLGKELANDEFEGAFHAVERDGRTLSGADAIPSVLERLPLGALPAAAIRHAPPLRRLVEKTYGFVSRHRHRFSRSCKC